MHEAKSGVKKCVNFVYKCQLWLRNSSSYFHFQSFFILNTNRNMNLHFSSTLALNLATCMESHSVAHAQSGVRDFFLVCLRSGQVCAYAPEQHVSASIFRRYSRGLHLAIPQTDAWPIPISLRYRSSCCNHGAHCWPVGLLHSRGSLTKIIWWAGSVSRNEPHVHTAAAETHGQ